MAEILEEMQERALPEYEDMLRFGICTEEKLKTCIGKRRSFQSKITQGEKTVRSYVDYIMYEKMIHKWVMEKEGEYGNALILLKSAIVKRIIMLFRQGLARFPHEDRLWQSFISFCKKSAKHEVMGVYEKMLSYHGDKPFVWCDAGLWAFEYSSNMPKVKELFVRALQRHPCSEAVNSTFFQILLSQAAQMSDEKNLENDTLSEQDLGLQQVEVVYRNSRRLITNIHYFLGLLERCEEELLCVISAPIQKIILDDLMANFSNEEILWDTLAQRELRGFNLTDLKNFYRNVEAKAKNVKSEPAAKKAKLGEGKENQDEETTAENVKKEEDKEEEEEVASTNGNLHLKFAWQKRSMSRRIQLCFKTYNTAVTVLRTPKMWDLFIKAMLKINGDTDTHGELKRQCLSSAFRLGHASKLMSVEHYSTLKDLLMTNLDGWKRAAQILTEALEFHSSIELHRYLLQLLTFDDDYKTFDTALRKGIERFGPSNSYPLYETAIRFYILGKETQSMAEELYQEACQHRESCFAEMRAEYLGHMAIKYGIEKGRKLYDDLYQLPPPIMSLHLKMASLEERFAPRDEHLRPLETPRWRLCYERNILHFGKTDTKPWMDYIQFETTHGKPKNVPLLYERAKNTLNDEVVEKFISEYALLREFHD